MTAPDPYDEAIAALMANAAGGELHEIRSIAARLGRLVKHLERFSFPFVAAPLAGLLTRPENHCATTRIEALIHLAALASYGNKAPQPRHLRQWLNTMISDDPICQLEVSVEDVFVSNVGAWGNYRLFDGRWKSNSDQVQLCVETLFRLQESPWAAHALRHVMALLRVSEAVADRAGIARNSRTTSTPRETIAVSTSGVAESSGHVHFSDDDLVAIGVDRVDLNPFVFRREHAESLGAQSIGHTALERRPLVRDRGHTTVALPTSIGAAIRRFAVERAATAGDLGLFQATCHSVQFNEIFLLGGADWDIGHKRMLEPDPDDGMREFVGAFDDQAYVHVLFVPDDFEDVAKEGLTSVHSLEDTVRERINDRAAGLAREVRCQRGLTVLVHGGIGREHTPVWGDLPDGWHQLCLCAPDFMLLGSEIEFTAMRAWKLLEMVAELEAEGVVFPNLHGFVNVVAFADHVGFELVPKNSSPGPMLLHSDFILPLRHRVRTALDRHVALGPDGNSWIDVQRDTKSEYLDEARGRLVFLSRTPQAHGELLACVESASRPWWVQCSRLPEGGWHLDVALGFLDMVLGWLVRLIPLLEDRNATLPSGPVTIRVRFSDIETFDQRDTQMPEAAVAPAVVVEGREVGIDCTSHYLRCLLSAGNLGDRLMIASLVRGVDSLAGNPAASDAELEEWVRDAIGSESARFLKMIPSRTLEDAIYDVAALPKLRLLMPEDRAWSRLGLARRAGYEGVPGPVPSDRAVALLNDAVDASWQRISSRLVELSRESVIERSLLNYVAARKDHRDWLRSTAAQLALYDPSHVRAAASERVLRRETAGLACRIIAEMALCTSPYGTGSPCSRTDLDFLVAEVATLLDCAGQSDALRYGLATHPPVMHPNGSFGFDESAVAATGLLITERWRRTFRDAATDDEVDGMSGSVEGVADPEFPSAFLAEFGLSPEQYGTFVHRLTLEALQANGAHLRLRRSEVEQRLLAVGVVNPAGAFEAFALVPRSRWDEDDPENASARDWWPWRYNRRLSIMRRPLCQLSMEIDPLVIVVPSILAGTLRYLHQAAFGDLPGTLFDTPEMTACIGRAVNRNGHEFARRVAERLGALRWRTEREVGLTRLGGEKSLGDVDVLAWQPATGLVYAVECKSLRFDRTCGEIGERLVEFSAGTVDGKRTQLQKHLDRISYLRGHPQRLADYLGIPVDRLRLRSALVTEQIVPMQFSGRAREVLDLVTDYELLEAELAG
ncbi:MAG: hypothetical protein OXQ84_14815 [bacterium]|nr:hypothetical protein [bacterium]